MTHPQQPPADDAGAVYGFLTGRQIGYARTDATYLRPGTLAVRGRPGRWAYRPGWQRQAYRLGVLAASAGSWAAYAAAPTLTASAAAALAAVGGGHGARVAKRNMRMRKFRRAYIRPVLGALRPALGDAPVQLHISPELGTLVQRLARPMSPAETAVRAWYGEHVEPVVRWLPERAQRGVWALQRRARPLTGKLAVFRVPHEEDVPRIELTAAVPYLTVEQQRHVASVIGAKIPAGDLAEPTWDQVGEQVKVVWKVRRRPPASCGYADLDARFAGLAEHEFFLGLGVGGRPVTVSLEDDSPHIAISASTGAGKSVLAQLIALQILARGGQIVILDRKGSHAWAIGLPGVVYCRTVAQMHDELIRLAALADERNARAFGNPDVDLGPRIGIVAEELNATFDLLRDYWDEIREKGEPKKSPAVKALKDLLFMGRAALMNALGIAQMLTARAIGGPEARECFSIRCLARYTRNAWHMLVPEASMPRASRTRGRWQVVIGGVATETQVCFLSPAEVRLFLAKHGVSPGARTPLMGSDQEMSPGRGDVGDIVDPLDERVTLRQAVERGIMPWGFDAAKKRMQRARKDGRATVPAVVGRDGNADLFRVGDLIVWVESELGVAA